MYDPARDIFTESQSLTSPQIDGPDLSALDTLADLAAAAEVASLPATRENTKDSVEQNGEKHLLKDENMEEGHEEVERHENHESETTPGDRADVAGARGPELSLKVTLQLKKDKNRAKPQEMSDLKQESHSTEPLEKKDQSAESPGSPMKREEAAPRTSPPMKSPNDDRQEDSPLKSEDAATQDRGRNEKGEPAYPIPLSLSRLAKIPKKRTAERSERPNKDHNEQKRDASTITDTRRNSDSRSPPSRRSPHRRSHSPIRRGSDDRYRPNQSHIDSYRPSRDRDDHYSPPPKRPASPSGSHRPLKRPVRRDVTAQDRERERRERQLRDAEREKAALEAARSRPIYESVRQHYNDREERGRDARKDSRLFALRKFNNWIKSVLIAKFIPERTEEEVDEDRGLFVLDIGCGKGGDLTKWQKQPNVQAYVGVDVADVSIIHAEQRAADLRGRRFSTRFFAMDCFVVLSPSVTMLM
jgi:mRNA capping enzyme